VFGVLYVMTAEDEHLLDLYEGVDYHAPSSQFGDLIDVQVRPKEQEDGAYNKWYIPAKITKWLDRVHSSGEEEEVEKKEEGEEEDGDDVTVLVYVDEQRVKPGPPKSEYIGRMNRAIAESVELGMPKDWVESVMRKAIPES